MCCLFQSRLIATTSVHAYSPLAVSVMVPVWTLWWLRPVSSAARVGEQSAVVWKAV